MSPAPVVLSTGSDREGVQRRRSAGADRPPGGPGRSSRRGFVVRAASVVLAAGAVGTVRPRVAGAATTLPADASTTLATVLRAAPASVIALPAVRQLLGGTGLDRTADDQLAALSLPVQQTVAGALELLDATWPYVTPYAQQTAAVRAAALAWAADTTGTIAVPDFGPLLVASGGQASVADAVNDAVRSHLIVVLQGVQAAIAFADDPAAFHDAQGFDDDERALFRDPAFLLGLAIPVIPSGPLADIDRQPGSPVATTLPSDWRVRWRAGGRVNPITGRFA